MAARKRHSQQISHNPPRERENRTMLTLLQASRTFLLYSGSKSQKYLFFFTESVNVEQQVTFSIHVHET